MAAAAPSGADLHLEVLSGNAAGFEIVIDERLVIGRHSDGPGRLADDPELSRHHAEIARAPDGSYTIEDLASTNGTIVNGSRITSPMPLVTGDSIEVGGTSIRVSDAPGKPAPTAAALVDARAATVTVDTPAAMRAAIPEPPAADDALPATEVQTTPEFDAQSEGVAGPVPGSAPEPEPVAAPDPFAAPEPPVAPEPMVEPVPEPLMDLEPEPPSHEGVPRLALQLIVDAARGEAEIRFDEASAPIRLGLVEGRWQVIDGGA
jgi:pSer/pThr/pTyr-binding forkhead associated (FHA) protein